MKKGLLNWRVNNQIKAPEVRVIGADGKQIGILKIEEALSKAREVGLDLVEIAPNANPPVVKITDLGKLRYQEEKRLKKGKKASKGGELKEIRFSPFIADHDFEVRLGRIEEFLAQGNKIRVVVVFKGRELGSKKFGYDILSKLTERLKGRISIDMEPKFLGRHLILVISPTKKTKKEEMNKSPDSQL